MSFNKPGITSFMKEAEKRNYEPNSNGTKLINKKTGGEAFVSESGKSVVINNQKITSLHHAKTTNSW